MWERRTLSFAYDIVLFLTMMYDYSLLPIVIIIILHIGCDRVVPVDIYVPGCPPTAEALLYGMF